MVHQPENAVNLANLTEKEICLAEAYAHSVGQDQLIAEEFESALGDGLIKENLLKNTN